MPPRELVRRFWPFARPYRLAILAGVAFVALLPAVQAAEIWMFKIVVDEVIVPADLGALPWIGAVVLGLTMAGAALSFAEDYAWTWAGERFLLDLRATFFAHLQRLSFDTLDRRRLGDLIARLGGDIQAIESFVLGGLGEAISALARIFFFAGALFLLDPQLALYAFLLAPPFYLAARYFARLILDGGRVDPFSGRRIGPGNRCPGASRAVVRRLNAAVAGRRYTGVQDRDDYARSHSPAGVAFYDPDASEPLYPGLLDRTQRPFVAEGLNVPWYSSRGNHDALVQGFFGARRGARVATGCRKAFPSLRPVRRLGNPWDTMVGRLGAGTFRWVPPDRRRRLATVRSFKRLHGRADRGHGFELVSRAERRASRGAAAYYSWTPRPGLRLVAIDTVGEGGGSDGNLDHPQYRWLSRTLRAAGRRGELVIVYGHHSLETMRNPRPDERAGRCGRGRLACDADPRRSAPLHYGKGGPASLRSLLLRNRNVVLFLTGHVHRHRAQAHLRRAGAGGFWQVTTASHISFPQQTRLIELMDNLDGTLSIFATALDTASPVATPASGTPASGLSDTQLSSISRRGGEREWRPAGRAEPRAAGGRSAPVGAAQRSSTAAGSSPE